MNSLKNQDPSPLREDEVSKDACAMRFEAVPTPANPGFDSQSSSHKRGRDAQVYLLQTQDSCINLDPEDEEPLPLSIGIIGVGSGHSLSPPALCPRNPTIVDESWHVEAN